MLGERSNHMLSWQPHQSSYEPQQQLQPINGRVYSTDVADYSRSDADVIHGKRGKQVVGKASPPPATGWNPRASMAVDTAKGLLNLAGENNCFLNSAIQVLWNLDAFRRNFRLLTGHACMESSCIFCALKKLFMQYQFSNCPAFPASCLREALAETFADQQRYQLGVMDDAAECFENILMRIHVHLAHGVSEDACLEPHCISHRKFAMSVVEQAVCQCNATCEPFSFTQIVQYIPTCTIINHEKVRQGSSGKSVLNFGHLLSSVANDGEVRKCPKNCGGYMSVRRTLTNTPDVICIGFVWDSDRPSSRHISRVVGSIDTVLHPADMFFSVVDVDWAVSARYNLVGVVCYYGKHYSTFFFHSKMKIWILFDDSKVKKLGADWKCVVDRCCRGHYQPLLLLYANQDGGPIDVSAAPKTVTQLRSQQRHFTERARDVTRRSLLPPRNSFQESDYVDQYGISTFDLMPGSQTPSGYQSRHSEVASGDSTARNDRRSTRPRDKSYTHAVNEAAIYAWEQTSTDNYGTWSSLASSRYSDVSDTSGQYSFQSGADHYDGRQQAVSDTKLESRFANSSSTERRDAAPGHDHLCPRRNDAQFPAGVDDYNDDAPYFTSDKVQQVMEKIGGRKISSSARRYDNKWMTPASNEQNTADFGDKFDAMSLNSHKDSGYRSNDDRRSASPTPSGSTSTHSADGVYINETHGIAGRNAGAKLFNKIADYKSLGLCSSSDSLSSAHTGLSLPVGYEQQFDTQTGTDSNAHRKASSTGILNYELCARPATTGRQLASQTESASSKGIWTGALYASDDHLNARKPPKKKNHRVAFMLGNGDDEGRTKGKSGATPRQPPIRDNGGQQANQFKPNYLHTSDSAVMSPTACDQLKPAARVTEYNVAYKQPLNDSRVQQKPHGRRDTNEQTRSCVSDGQPSARRPIQLQKPSRAVCFEETPSSEDPLRCRPNEKADARTCNVTEELVKRPSTAHSHSSRVSGGGMQPFSYTQVSDAALIRPPSTRKCVVADNRKDTATEELMIRPYAVQSASEPSSTHHHIGVPVNPISEHSFSRPADVRKRRDSESRCTSSRPGDGYLPPPSARVKKVQSAEDLLSCNAGPAPAMYPYRGLLEESQSDRRAAAEEEKSPVTVKGRRCVTPAGCQRQQILTSEARKPPLPEQPLRHASSSSSLRDKSKDVGRGIPNALTGSANSRTAQQKPWR